MFGFGRGLKGKSSKEILNKYFIDADKYYFVTTDQLASSVGLNAREYARNFTPNSSLLNDITFSAIAGGSIGAIHGTISVIGNAVGAANRAYITTSFMLGGFYLPENSESLSDLETLAVFASNGEIKEVEFVRALSSLLFDSGNGLPSFVEFDRLGGVVYKNDKDKLVGAMIYQFWIENCVPASRVRDTFLS